MADAITTAEIPSRGLVTWEAEGNEGGPYHSRTLHVPSDSSGLTLGRGYDMKNRSQATILQDLSGAGVPLEDAKKISLAAGLSGADARKFVADNALGAFEITKAAQKLLFDTSYQAEAREARRLCSKDDVVDTYGACDWDKLHPAIVDTLVDLKYRGDYTGAGRKKIQRHVVANDLPAFALAMADKDNWPNVPKSRFDSRAAALQDAVRQQRGVEAAAQARQCLLPGEPRMLPP